MKNLHLDNANNNSIFAFKLILAIAIFFVAHTQVFADDKKYKRIVAIGGSVTEIIYALGEEKRLIARDTTSVFPEAVFNLPDVGYIRQLSPEGVLSVNPDLILALEGSGPPEAIEALKSANVPIVFVPDGYTAKAITEKVNFVGKAIGVSEKAEQLSSSIYQKIEAVTNTVKSQDKSQNVLFVLSLQGGKILASGKNTAANGIIKLAGSRNVVSEFEGYKQVSDEAIIAAKPNVILMMQRRGNHSNSDEDVLSHPAIATTPAGKNKKIIRMDGAYLLGFGPRTASAISDLNQIFSN